MIDNNQTTIWAMRHGPTTWNVEKRIQGNVDTDIIPEKLNAYFQQLGVEILPQPDVIVLSEMKRATQTANALQAYRHWPEIPLHKDVRLNERGWGILEGIPTSEARQRMLQEPDLRIGFPIPKNLQDVAKLWDTDGYKVKGGESIDEVAQRVKTAFSEIEKRYIGKKILFISHAGVLISLGLDHHMITQFTITENNKGRIVMSDINNLGKK